MKMPQSAASIGDSTRISRRNLTQALGAGVAAGLAGCLGGQSGGGGDGEVVTDMADRDVEVPETVESLIVLGPGGLRMISQLDAADMVIGVEENEQGWSRQIPYNMANPHFQDLPVIGPQFGGEAELIAREDPDVIFWSRLDPADAQGLQEKTGIPVVSITKDDFGPNRQVLYESWDVIADVLDKHDRVESLKDYIETSIDDLDGRTADIPDDEKESVYAGGVSHRGPQGLQSTKAPFPPLEWVNANFAAEELHYEEEGRDRLKAEVSKEKILQWNPEVIFVDLGNLETLQEDVRSNPEYEDLDAFQNDRVYGYHPYHQYHLNESTTLANGYFMGDVLFPEQFEDVSPAAKADEIYEQFFGEAVYDQVAERFGDYGSVDLT